MFGDDNPRDQRFQPFVKDVLLPFDFHPDQRSLGAEPHAAGGNDADFAFQSVFGHRRFQQVENVIAAGRLAAGGMAAVNGAEVAVKIL